MTYKSRTIWVMRRTEALSALLEAASEQGGYVTALQAVRLGLGRDDIARLASSKDLRRVRRGVYALRHADARHEDEIAAWLHFQRDRLPWERTEPPSSVLSHASAAALRRLGTIIPVEPVLTLTAGRLPELDDVRVHRIPLRDEDWTWTDLGGVMLPVTTSSRTIVDLLLDGEEPSYVGRAIVEATRRGEADRESIVDAARHRKGPSKTLERRVTELLERVT
jgi:predicted transcriptional regulator of viral defense system